MANTIEIAQELMREHRDGKRAWAIAPARGVANPAAAYDVQEAYVRLLLDTHGTRVAGYKIGLTTKRMQDLCKIDRPIAGVVLADRVHATGSKIETARYGHLGLEFEICLELGRDLRGGATDAELRSAVAGVSAGVELIEDRNADYKALEVLSLIADNSWNGGIVIGSFSPSWPDLGTVEGTVFRDGAAVDHGFGRDVLGNPLESLRFLADHLGERGGFVPAGSLVMTGNLVTTRFPAAGERYRFELSGLGAVELTVA